MKVIVLGAGIVGAATARALAARGVEVDLVDAGEVSGGTTGLGEGNVLCSDKEAGPELDLAVLGLAAYDDIERRYGERARIRRKGSLLVHRDAATLAAEPARLEPLAAAGVRCELLGPEQARALEPGARPGPARRLLLPRRPPVRPARDRPRHGRGAGHHACARGRGSSGSCRARAWRPPRGRCARTRSCSPPGRGARSSRAARACTSRSSRARASSPGSAARCAVRHKVIDSGYLAAVAAPAAGLQVSTVIETTWDGDVLVGSSRERRGFDTTVDPAVTQAMLERAAG